MTLVTPELPRPTSRPERAPPGFGHARQSHTVNHDASMSDADELAAMGSQGRYLSGYQVSRNEYNALWANRGWPAAEPVFCRRPVPGGRVATGSGRATKPDVPGWSLSTGSTVASPPARVERPSSMASAVVQRQTSTSSSWSRILMLGRSASRVAPSDQSSHRVRSSCELKHRLSGRIGRNSRQDSHAQHQAAMALAVYGLKSAFWRSNSVQSDASHGRQLRRTRKLPLREWCY